MSRQYITCCDKCAAKLESRYWIGPGEPAGHMACPMCFRYTTVEVRPIKRPIRRYKIRGHGGGERERARKGET